MVDGGRMPGSLSSRVPRARVVLRGKALSQPEAVALPDKTLYAEFTVEVNGSQFPVQVRGEKVLEVCRLAHAGDLVSVSGSLKQLASRTEMGRDVSKIIVVAEKVRVMRDPPFRTEDRP